jgi:hypothetical protein
MTLFDTSLPTNVKNICWWDEDDPVRSGMMLTSIVKQIRDRHKWRYDANVVHAGLYAGNCNAGGVIMTPMGDYTYKPRTKPRNIIGMAVDTYVCSVAKHQPLPKIQTSMGNWAQQKRAKKATQFVEGCFHSSRFIEKHDMLWKRDSAIYSGGGVVKVVRKGRKGIGVERVFPWELLFDEWDARYGEPRNCYQILTIDLGRALALFGKKREDETDDEHAARVDAIKKAATSDPKDDWTWEGECDTTVVRVRFAHGYHLCDDVEAHDDKEDHECNGTHDLTVLGGPRVLREKFKWDEFPFQQLFFRPPLAGAIGMSLAEMGEGWQETADVRHQSVEDCVRSVGGAMFLVDNNADIPATRFMNGGVKIIKQRPGAKVQAITPSPVHPMVMQLEQSTPNEALSEFGFNSLQTQGQKPAGIDSGVALQEYSSATDGRRMMQASEVDKAYAGLGRKFMWLAKDIAEDEGELEVQVPMAKGTLPLKWSDVKLDDFQVRVMPSSWLPQQPAARLEVLNYLFDRQVITPEEFRRLFAGPDYEWELDLVTSEHLVIDEKLEAVYDAENDDELRYAEQQAVPNNYQDPEWFLMRAQQRYNQGQREGLPQENQDGFLRLMSQCKTLLLRNSGGGQPTPAGQIPGAPPPPDAGMAPPGMPMPPGAPPGMPMPPPAPGVQ